MSSGRVEAVWEVRRPDGAAIEALREALGLDALTATLLVNRGFTDPEEVQAFLTPRLSSYWLRLVTAVPTNIATALIEGLSQDVIASDNRLAALVPQALLTFDEAAAEARAISQRRGSPPRLGVVTMGSSPLGHTHKDAPARLARFARSSKEAYSATSPAPSFESPSIRSPTFMMSSGRSRFSCATAISKILSRSPPVRSENTAKVNLSSSASKASWVQGSRSPSTS